MLESETLGQEWSDLIQAWIRFEETAGGDIKGSVPAKGRPPAVGEWIQRARNPRYRPIITDTKDFGSKHMAWWKSFQPDWRVPSNDNLELLGDNGELVLDDSKFICNDDGDLEGLRQPGANGLLSVLASLYFWGSAVKDSGKKSRKWAQSVEDCSYVLCRLASTA